MTAVRMRFLVPPEVAAPRGAVAAGHLAALLFELPHRLAAVGRSMWRAIEAHGERRAARQLLSLAEHDDSTRPEHARLLRDAAGELGRT